MKSFVNSPVKNFPFVYVCDGKAEYDNYVYLFYDKKEKLTTMSSSEEIFESIYGFVPKEFLESEYITSFLVDILETSERFERVKVYSLDGGDDFDVELDETLKKLPKDIIEYYTGIINNREPKKKKQNSKDQRINCLEEEVKELKDELYKFKCQMTYELSGWEGFCKFINII